MLPEVMTSSGQSEELCQGSDFLLAESIVCQPGPYRADVDRPSSWRLPASFDFDVLRRVSCRGQNIQGIGGYPDERLLMSLNWLPKSLS